MRRAPALKWLRLAAVIALVGLTDVGVAHAGMKFGGEPQDNLWDVGPTFCRDGTIITATQTQTSTEIAPFSLQLVDSAPSVQTLLPSALASGVSNTTFVNGAVTFLWTTSQTPGTPVTIRVERWDHGFSGSPTAVLNDANAVSPADGSPSDDVITFTYSISPSDVFVPAQLSPNPPPLVVVPGGEVIGSPDAQVKDCSVFPTTTATIVPAPNTNGWNNGPVNVQLSAVATAGVFPVATTYYAVDNATCTPASLGSCSVYSGPVPISAEGQHTLYFFSADAGNNVEAQQHVQVNIDTISPTVTYSGNAGTYTVDQNVNITCHAADNPGGSGLASTTCQNISGPAYTFPLGTNTYTATATDLAGNVGTGSTSFTVQVTYGSLCNLTRQFIQSSSNYGAHPLLGKALVTGLCDVLFLAKYAHTTAQKSLFIAAYRYAVQGLVTPGWLTQAQATTLSTLAKALQ